MIDSDYDTDIAALMEEPPGGENYGRMAPSISTDPGQERASDRRIDFDGQRRMFLIDGGWSVERGTAHRGVIQAY